MNGQLILEDGKIFRGELLNESLAAGEVVFNTGMTGYQEILTDPSYCRQLVTLTYPMVGNYGAAASMNESRRSFVGGFIVGELCGAPHNWQSEETLSEFLTAQKITCLYNVDTRALTRHIRAAGTMKGAIVSEDTDETAAQNLLAQPLVKEVVSEVTTEQIYRIEAEKSDAPKVVCYDFGVKSNILKNLHKIGCDLTVVPAQTKAEDVLAMNPDGIFLSNGPGDPKDVPEVIAEVKKLIGQKPIFGICLGHQLLALAMGADTYKLKFGHRGSNQPVKDLAKGAVYISSQNHGYAVEASSLENLPLEVTHISVNDGTVEGIKHRELPIFSVQYHPEASPGPDDNRYLFGEFMAVMGRADHSD